MKECNLKVPRQEVELESPVWTPSSVATTDRGSLVRNAKERSPSPQSAFPKGPVNYNLTPTPTPPLPPRSKLRPKGTHISMSELSAETPILREAAQISISRHPTPTPIYTSSKHPSTPALAINPGPPSVHLPYPLPAPSPTHLRSLIDSNTTYTLPSQPTYVPKQNPSTISRTRQANLLLLKSYLIHKTPYSSPCSPTSPKLQIPLSSSTSQDLDSALSLAEAALRKARGTGRPNLVAKCHQFRGYVLRRMGRWGEAYGDFVRAASIRRFAADEGKEGMESVLEECVRMIGGAITEGVEAAVRDGDTEESDGMRDVSGVEMPEPNGGLLRQGTFGSWSSKDNRDEEAGGAASDAISGWSQSVNTSLEEAEKAVYDEVWTAGTHDVATQQSSTHQQLRQKLRANKIIDRQAHNGPQGQSIRHAFIGTVSESAVEQARAERTTSASTTQTFYTAYPSQPSASTYHTAETRHTDFSADICQAENNFHGIGAWHIMNSTTCHDDVHYRASSTSPAPIYPLTPIQDFPRPFYRRDGTGRMLLPSAPAQPELRKVRGTEFEGKYWLLESDMEDQ